MDTVAIVIPVYNTGSLVIEAVQSALSQTPHLQTNPAQSGSFQLDEIILVDDRSTDPATLDALHQVKQYDKVTVLSNTRRKGSAGARNTGILHSKATWIAFLDGDDRLAPQSIELRLNAGRQHPNAGWIGADFQLMDAQGKVSEDSFFKARAETAAFIYRDDAETVVLEKPIEQFLTRNLTMTITTMVKRDLLLQVGLFDEDLLRAQDYNLFVRLAAVTDYVFVRHPTAHYRIHPGSITESGPGRRWAVFAFEKFFEQPWVKPYTPLIRHRICGFLLEDAVYYQARSEFKGQLSLLGRVFKYMPAEPLAFARYFKSFFITALKSILVR